MKVRGKAWCFGKNINTDLIFPNRYFKPRYASGEMGSLIMSGADPDFPNKVSKGDIIVGGANFGCGSSREEAAASMYEAGIGALIAPSFGRIFMRNCINLGVPVIPCPEIAERVSEGDEVEVDLGEGLIRNITTGHEVRFPAIPAEMLDLLQGGGLAAYTRRRHAELKGEQPVP